MLDHFFGSLFSEIGVVHDACKAHARRRFDFPQDFKCALRISRQRTVEIYDKQHFIVIFFQNIRDITTERKRSAIISADVQNGMNISSLHQPIHFLRKRGKIHVGVGKRQGDHTDTRLLQFFSRIRGTEVGIHDINVR